MRSDADKGQAYANRVFTLVGGGLIIITIVLVLAAPLLVRLYAPSELYAAGMAEQRQSLEAFARLCLPQVVFYGLYVLFGQVLNARGRFGPMMFAPIANNLIACVTLAIYLIVYGPSTGSGGYSDGEMLLLGLGSTIGVVVQAAVLWPVLRGTGFRYHPRFDFRGTGLSHTGRLAIWTVLFVVVNQLAYLIITRIAVASSATVAAEGDQVGLGATVYQSAFLVIMVPHALLTVSLATAALPRLSRLAADRRLGDMQRDLVSTMRLAVAGVIFAAVLLLVLAQPIARLLFGWGAGAGDTEVLGLTLMAFAPGLIAFTVHFLTLRGFYALEDTKTPFSVQCVVAVSNVAVALLLTLLLPVVGSVGLAASFSIAYTIGAIVSTAALARRLGGLHRVELAWFLLRALVATAPAALAALVGLFLAHEFVGTEGSLIEAVAAVGLGCGLALVTYLATARRFGLREIAQVIDVVAGKIRRGRRPSRSDAAPRGEPDAWPPPPTMSQTAPAEGTAGPSTPAVDSTAEHAAADFGTGEFPVFVDARELQVGDTDQSDATRGTVPSQAAEPGTLLAGRYRLEELLARSNGATTWRGVDEVLSRPVALHLLPVDDPRVDDLAEAARAAAGLTDPHFLRMLDVTTEPAETDGPYAFVVREWVSGRNLTAALGDGPFDTDDAVYVARELAAAMASAHRAGLAHLRLEPDTVVLADNGQVKVVDLAVDRVLRGTSADDVAWADARGIGRVLYACLTARWPDGPHHGLSAAPTQDGRLCSPRQVLAGVPGPLDEICDRILGDPPRAGRPPLNTPAEIEEALDYVAGRPSRRRAISMPAVAPVPASTSASVDSTATWRRPDTPPEPVVRPTERRSGRKLLGGVVAAVLLAGALLLGYQLATQAFGGGDDETTTPPTTSAVTSAPPPAELDIAAATSYDLESTGGNGEENEELAANAIDGDPATAWTTVNYSDPMAAQGKEGVGLVLDLGADHAVSDVQLSLLTPGGKLELRAAPEGSSAVPDEIGKWTVVQSVDAPEQQLDVTFDTPVTTRYVLVWFTELPQFEDTLKDGIAEAVLRGA
jgi:putative peptidoglycan lipid II flippase